MATKMVPVEFDLIDEGRLREEVDEELQSMARELMAYKKRHGKDLAKGARAVLSLKITLKIEDNDDGLITLRGDVSKKMPGRPPRVTTALEDAEQDGTPTLFVRKTGSTKDDPRQQVLCTNKGQTVDQETGEVLEDEK